MNWGMDQFWTGLEIFGAVMGLASVYLTVRQNIWCWPTGLVMVIAYGAVFFHKRLFSDVGLQAVYVVLQIYGWYYWKRGGEGATELKVTRLRAWEAGLWIAVTVAGSAALGYVMHTYAHAALPYKDAIATVVSLIAQWLMARKVLECWLIWIAVDLLFIAMFLSQDLFYTAVLYLAFIILDGMGWREWNKTLLKPAAA